MNLNNDSANGFTTTEDGEEMQGAMSYSIPQNSYSRVTAKLMCVNENSNKVVSFTLNALIQRASGSCRIVFNDSPGVPIGDAELALTSCSISVLGSSLLFNVTGLAATTLDWLVQMEINKVTE